MNLKAFCIVCLLIVVSFGQDLEKNESDLKEKVDRVLRTRKSHKRRKKRVRKKEKKRTLMGNTGGGATGGGGGAGGLGGGAGGNAAGSAKNEVPEGYPQHYPFLQLSYHIDNPPYAPTILVPYIEDDTVKASQTVTTMPSEVIVQDENGGGAAGAGGMGGSPMLVI